MHKTQPQYTLKETNKKLSKYSTSKWYEDINRTGDVPKEQCW